MQKGTIAIHFVHQALQAVRQQGGETGSLLAGAGIPPALLDAKQARVPATSYSTLWRLVNQALDDEFFGQDSRRMKVGSFAMLCHSVIHCRTLAQVLRRTVRFFNLLLDDLHSTLEHDGNDASITLHTRPGTPVRVFAQETLLVMMHGLMCWISGRRVPIRVARFAYPEPAYGAEYHAMYSARLEFGQAVTAIVFDASALDWPVVQTEQSLKTFLRTAPENVVLKYKNQQSLYAKIRRYLKARPLAQWPHFDELATELHLTDSTLRRRLSEEGRSYQTIKDELRRDMAIDLLSHTKKSVGDVAVALGFAEPSAFHRAFKKWTGTSPGDYRAT